MNPLPPSAAEQIQKVSCPPPTRARHDDQIVELFLRTWQQGRFTDSIEWLPQNRRNVEVVASDTAGVRVAVEHTRVFAFEDHKLQEELLRPIAEALEAEPKLEFADRCFNLRLYPNFLDRALSRKRDLVLDVLLAWAVENLPRLRPRRHRPYLCEIPVSLPSGKAGRIRIDVEVLERVSEMRAVSVGGYLPSDKNRLLPVLRKALETKLPKLVDAAAQQRVLLLELPTTDSERRIINAVRELRPSFPLLDRVHAIVVADTFACASEGRVVFWISDPSVEDFTEILQPVITGPPATVPVGSMASLTEQAREFAAAAKAMNTLRAYASDWNDFRNWCEEHELDALPATPETVALYLTCRAATLKTSSLARRLTTISRAHEAGGHPSPATMRNAVVSEVWKGIRRKKGTAEQGKTPLLTADLRNISNELPDDLQGLRDRALLLIGFAGGFRRSELASLRIEDLKDTPEGMVAVLRRSKTDPEGQGRPVALPYGSDPRTCPVRAIRTWLEAAAITTGPLLRAVDQFGLVSETALCADSVGFIIKRAATRGGLKTAEYAGHSLRAGLATQAAMNGAGELAIMKQTGHRSLATVRKYIRDGALFRDNAATKLGL